MQVPHFCCLTCSKSIGKYTIPFRRMRLGLLEPFDVITLAAHDDRLFGESSWTTKEARKEELLKQFEEFRPLETRQYISNVAPRPLDQIEEEAEVFGSLVEDGAEYYRRTVTQSQPAAVTYAAFGLLRICCKENVCNPPIWPIYAPDKPKGSIIRHDDGLKRRVVYRTPLDDGYTAANISVRSIMPAVQVPDDPEIDNMDI